MAPRKAVRSTKPAGQLTPGDPRVQRETRPGSNLPPAMGILHAAPETLA